jgi:hypothetical protein
MDPDRFKIIIGLHPKSKYLGRYYCSNQEWRYKAGKEIILNRCDLFMELMEKLKKSKIGDRGFWCNRNLIIANLEYIYVYYDCEKKDILGFFWAEDTDEYDYIKVELIESFPRGVGYGKIMIEYLKNRGKDILANECLNDSYEFWKKMGSKRGRKIMAIIIIGNDRYKIPDLDFNNDKPCLIYEGAWIPLDDKVAVDEAMKDWKSGNKDLTKSK